MRRSRPLPHGLNAFPHGWAGYFRLGNSTHVVGQIGSYARMWIGGLLTKKHRRTRKFGRAVASSSAEDSLSLIVLYGTLIEPRPFLDWRGRPNAGGERRR
ncbi:hypothetical protein OG866_43845 [Streptomyces sp. NBC_00663]|uniref:group II intron maturase-specific domain-containing protein n=1 Tax=Streptomyces sp. NBC_00663 TaxID=2975801 RepID=UPI002E363879|nr:group II intron maturase-specific domain-containing protein [Streptomyces sp. NBC_00663]